MKNLDLDMIRINMADSMVCSFSAIDSKSLYANRVLDEALAWLSYNLSHHIVYLGDSKDGIKLELIDYLWKVIPKPSPTSWIHSYIPFAFNWALKSIITLIVNKVFSLIFVGDTLEVNSKYVQNNPENTA